MDWKIELIHVPVSDVDRAKDFYVNKLGFNADHDQRVTTGCASCSSPRPDRRARSRSARASAARSGPARST